MMIEPPIDKLLEQTGGNRYVLCALITKRAKEIESVLELADQDKKAISIACEEIASGKVKASLN